MHYKSWVLLLLGLFLLPPLHAQDIEQWGRFEVVFKSPAPPNVFKEVTLTATFSTADTACTVAGFYDGNNTFRVRFMPPKMGTWQYATTSNVAKLNQQRGRFTCVKASGSNAGPVRVRDTYHFQYASGKPYYPFGTTAYAWTHMAPARQAATLRALKSSGFNKLRMCVFPKNYDLVKEEPTLFPFVVKEVKKDAAGKDVTVWDFDTFNPAFFQQLDKQIAALGQFGVEADLILFHPYDKGRWGFDALPNEVNIRYIKYVLARVASYRNVWWSLANEWDYVKSKQVSDWELLIQTVAQNDPYRHLCSIHGASATYYNYWNPALTHVSIQDETPVQLPSSAAILRNIYHKPVISDEVGYEGNLKSRWGRYSPEEMTYLIWNGVLGGTYVTHGECYQPKDPKDELDGLFWAKGGRFDGSSWQRVAFLRQLVEACPGPLGLADIGRDNTTATAGEGYYLVYFGKQMNDSWLFNLPAKNSSFKKLVAGTRFKVELIDTWEMTIREYPQQFETAAENDYRLLDKELRRVRLPLKPYMALRITALK